MARSAVRLVLLALGAVLVFAGFAAIPLGGEVAAAGLWSVIVGLFLVVVALIERTRYRSEAAERSNAPAGPGGGELPDSPPEARFRSTAEVFVDPSSGHRMRVLVDPRTGERRYVAEG